MSSCLQIEDILTSKVRNEMTAIDSNFDYFDS
jgi:hypothetical protein